jgi:hypothetical protein
VKSQGTQPATDQDGEQQRQKSGIDPHWPSIIVVRRHGMDLPYGK